MTLTNMKKVTAQRGFTIVELLIVIVVIAILAALVLTAYNGVQQRARDSSRASDVRAVATAVEAMRAEGSAYPTFATLSANGGTVKLDAGVAAKISDTGAGNVPSATNDKYQYYKCTTGTPVIDGAKIMWWKEETGTVQVRNVGAATGTGQTC